MMNMTMISLAAVAVLWFLSLLLGLIRGSKKAFSRFIVVLICAALAFGGTFAVKNNLPEVYTQFSDQLQQYIDNPEIFTFIDNAETTRNALLSFAGSLVSPILFLVLFVVFQILTWVLSLVFGILIGFIRLVAGNRKKAAHHPFRAMLFSTLEVVVVLLVFLTPISCYLGIATDNLDAVKASGLIPETTMQQVENLGVTELSNNPVLKAYHKLGGNFITKELTTITVGEEQTTLAVEMKSVISIAADANALVKKGFENFTEEDANTIAKLVSFGDSKLIPGIVGEALYQATDAWIQDPPQSFMGIAKPGIGETFDPAFDTLLDIFHEDAKNTANITEDFTTLGQMISVLVKNGLTANLKDTNAMVNSLTKGNTVSELVTALGSNARLKKLIPEITNIAMRAIGSALKLPENAEAIYSGCMGDIATAINAVKANGDLETQINALTPEIKEALLDSGIDIGVDDSVIKLFATTLVDEFGSKETVTADDVSAFFAAYGESMAEESSTAALNPVVENLAATEKSAGNENAAKLAALTKKIAAAAADTTKDDAAFKAAVENAMKETFGTDPKYSAVIDSVKTDISRDSVKEENFKNLESLKSPEAMKEVTVLITVEDLLVDVDAATENLSTSEAVEKEAESISTILSQAGSILNDTSSLNDISTAAATVGGVLDALQSSPSVGQEKTAKLVTAVFQSDMVCNDDMKLNKLEATKLAEKVTATEEGEKVAYEKTLNGVSSGLDIVTKMTDENYKFEEQDMKDLLVAMTTPNLAGMLTEYITEERLASFGLSGDALNLTSDILKNLFTEMGKERSNYDEEKVGLTNLFNLVASAAKSSSGGRLFGTTDSRTGKEAEAALRELLSSEIFCNTLTATVVDKNTNQVKTEYQDALNLNMHASGNQDYNDCKTALQTLYTEASGNTNKQLTIDSLATLLGIDIHSAE